MLRLARLTDYGILLLAQFAREREPRTHAARDLAAATELPLPTVSKILKTLARGGLLVSHRGADGGYSLARAPEAITVMEIVQALEGPVALTQCAEGPGHCSYEHQCPSASNLQAVNAAIHDALARVKLSDLAPKAPHIPLTTRFSQ